MADDHTSEAVAAYYGGAAEISHQVEELGAAKAILLVPPKGMPDSAAQALQGILQETAQLFLTESAAHLLQRREMLISALMPAVPAAALRQAGMEARARAAVLAASEWLTAKEVAARAGLGSANASATPWKWKQDGAIFAISSEGRDLYPPYALDADSGYRPFKSLRPVLAVFKGRKEGWGLAYWFASVNSFLGGQRPMDWLQKDPARVLAAAQDEVAGAEHG